MTELIAPRDDQLVSDLVASRAGASGRTVDEVAQDAMLNGRVWSTADRTAFAAKVRAMTPQIVDDSTALVRNIRDGR